MRKCGVEKSFCTGSLRPESSPNDLSLVGLMVRNVYGSRCKQLTDVGLLLGGSGNINSRKSALRLENVGARTSVLFHYRVKARTNATPHGRRHAARRS